VSEETLSNLLHEERRFEPPADLAANANVKADAYDEAERDPLGFWAKAAERLTWDTQWDQVLDWDDAPFAKWYVGGKLNASRVSPQPCQVIELARFAVENVHNKIAVIEQNPVR